MGLRIFAFAFTFNQEKALVGAFSVIVKTNGLFSALLINLASIAISGIATIRAINTSPIFSPASAGVGGGRSRGQRG